jgi:multimeric flavodoxin WrbA
MAKILVVYHSQGGNTRRMAEAVARGAREIENTIVILKKAYETTLEDLIECDGLAIGSPEYFGYMAGAIKDLFDRTYEKARGHRRIFRKPYSIFISAGNDGEGALRNIERICIGFQFKKVQEPIIARGTITDSIISICEDMGRTLALGCEEGIF